MLVFDDKKVDYPNTVCWLDDPTKCPKATHYSPRHTWIRGIVVHTVSGRVGPLKEGFKESARDLVYSKYFATTKRQVSCDYIVDTDGSIAATNDPVRYFTWHAEEVNGYTLGIEMVQDADGSVYADQIAATVKFIHFLCDRLGIQKQVPVRANKPVETVITRLQSPLAGRDFIGVYGHRNQTHNRGPGDPGNWIFEALLRDGFEGFDFGADQDLDVWKKRQRDLGLKNGHVDGVSGPEVTQLLKNAGYRDGIWVNGKITPS